MKLKILASSLAALALALAACSPAGLLNTITPSGSFSKAADMAYGSLDRQKLDIYAPDEPRADAPIVVFVHGGSWTDGRKGLYKFLAEGLTSEGFEVVVPNYRLYPEGRYPDFIQDTANALAFTAKRYADRPLIVMGHSAGAYNVLMAILDKSYLEAEGVNICETVSGVVSFSGPTGIIPLDSEPYITIFPDRFTGEDAPLNNVTGSTPPILFLHGSDDTTVFPQNSTALAEKITGRGGQADVKIYDGLNHTDVVKVMSRHFDGDATLKSDLVKFIENQPRSKQNFCL